MKTKGIADKIGIFFSSLCAIHCIAMPILILGSSNFFLHSIDNVWVERGFILLCLLIAAFSFIKYKRIHANGLPLQLLGIAMLFLITSVFVSNTVLEVFFSVIGSGFLITGHWINRKSLKYC